MPPPSRDPSITYKIPHALAPSRAPAKPGDAGIACRNVAKSAASSGVRAWVRGSAGFAVMMASIAGSARACAGMRGEERAIVAALAQVVATERGIDAGMCGGGARAKHGHRRTHRWRANGPAATITAANPAALYGLRMTPICFRLPSTPGVSP